MMWPPINLKEMTVLGVGSTCKIEDDNIKMEWYNIKKTTVRCADALQPGQAHICGFQTK